MRTNQAIQARPPIVQYEISSSSPSKSTRAIEVGPGTHYGPFGIMMVGCLR